jgi:hypothetical protein
VLLRGSRSTVHKQQGGRLVPYEAEQEAIHGNVSLRAQDKARGLICGGGLRASFSAAALWGEIMWLCKTSGQAIFAVVCLLGETMGSAYAQCPPFPPPPFCATEWSGGSIIDLGRLPGSTESAALGVNDVGQVVGQSVVGGIFVATEWSGGSVINLGGLPGARNSFAAAINDAGQLRGS